MRLGVLGTIFSFLRFYALGITNFIIFVILFFITHDLFKWHYLICNIFAYSVVIVLAAFGNVFWVFRAHSPHKNKYLLVFFTMLVYLSSLVLELISVYFLVTYSDINIYIIQIVVYLVSSIYCYTLNRFFVFE
jgi:putative flippase GtrA